MTILDKLLNGLFEPLSDRALSDRTGAKNIWTWWEKRRLAYNIIVIFVAACSFAICLLYGALTRSGESMGSFFGIIVAVAIGPILWNIAYCLGALCDLMLFLLNWRKCHSGPLLLRLGIAFSILLLCTPSCAIILFDCLEKYRK